MGSSGGVRPELLRRGKRFLRDLGSGIAPSPKAGTSCLLPLRERQPLLWLISSLPWTTKSGPALDYRNLEMRKPDRRCPGALGPEHPEPRRRYRRRLPLAGRGALSCPIGRDRGTDVRFAGVIEQPALSGASPFGAFKPAVSAALNGLPTLPQVAHRGRRAEGTGACNRRERRCARRVCGRVAAPGRIHGLGPDCPTPAQPAPSASPPDRSSSARSRPASLPKRGERRRGNRHDCGASPERLLPARSLWVRHFCGGRAPGRPAQTRGRAGRTSRHFSARADG
jgi:hypothetical protein